ncbi:MAG: hypothetical protein FD145_1629 [Candidatus Saganbacteria bacterium]|uniref:Heavy metal-binding domain-containing protein n=1 Tax=Candidatus Saganbacteria bacterium TaxID=2575572 RepID=A0A833KZF1_UNCSA|nr:MAG: hypothetical protein FD145_1629 [Candidatus Saganbacteria bacterium]
MKKLLIITFVLILAGYVATKGYCANEVKFSRFKGKALELKIPIYEGLPPENCSYKSLGHVTGEYKTERVFLKEGVVVIIFKALSNLADNATAQGANAVINVKGQKKGSGFIYTGEAVIFDTLPDK